MGKQEFWDDREEANKKSQDVAQLKREVQEWNELKEEYEFLHTYARESAEEDLSSQISTLERKLRKKELELFLSGPYDARHAIVSVVAGAGGRDAQDWAAMLLRMYERYCQQRGWETVVLEQSFGEAGGPDGRIGIKQASLEIKGRSAYGFLKREHGVHRLVRISPFSTQNLRHTSFALVEVLPTFEDAKEIEIKPQDIVVEYYKASGPGGQYVNKRETAIRLHHKPTGLSASCQSERSQASNREKAMQILMGKLYVAQQQSRKEELEKVKGGKIAIEWGSQIRSYVFHPYQMVKDHRTAMETSQIEQVMDGDLDEFIEAELQLSS